MTPKLASQPSEPTTYPAADNEDRTTQPTYRPTYPDTAKREQQLRRRRRADGDYS
jgi:hypothetical protein